MAKTTANMKRTLMALLALGCLLILTALPVSAKTYTTVYNGQDYSRVYDYTYYTTHTHPELAGKKGSTVLKYFVTKGIKKREQANEAFNVTWYYNTYPALRYAYGRTWSKYYLYYQKKGYKKGAVAPCPTLKDPINYYKVSGKKVSLAKIYNFEYFTTHNAAAYKYWRNQDDAGAVKYFVKTGMLAGMQGNEKRSSSSYAYRKLKKKIFPTLKSNEYAIADTLKSKSKYLILVNQKKHMVYVFEGQQYAWKKIMSFPCCVGRAGPDTKTKDGTWKVFLKRTFFITNNDWRCWYFSVFNADQGFHSVLYDSSDTPVRIMDGSMGVSVSHGCVRVGLSNAKWIYDNCPVGTTVRVYNCPW